MTHKVLTVDDSKTIRTIVKKAFKPYDCEMFEAENGVEGLAVAVKVQPDLIVLDLTMPVMNGLEMLEKLRGQQTFMAIPVIMLTAESGRENVIRIVKMGVKDYIVKPFKGEQLIERAEKILKLELKKDGDGEGLEVMNHIVTDGEFEIVLLSDKFSKPFQSALEEFLQKRIRRMKEGERKKVIFDLSTVSAMSVSLVKLLISLFSKCDAASCPYAVAANRGVAQEMKGLAELSSVAIAEGVDAAKQAI